MKGAIKFVGVALVFLTLNFQTSTVWSEQPKPKLVLQITVDQLRGDLPERYADRYGKGGFRYFLDQGTWYNNAHYQHSNLETVVGHATLATGAFPSAHGMVANVWVDQETGELAYGIEDSDYVMIGGQGAVDKSSEIDPTQAAARSEGRSPRMIIGSTFGDELSVATAGKAKIFGVSIKDRAAVTMAGHSGKAFWFSKKNGDFVSSTFYYDAYPDWVKQWNAKGEAAAYGGTSWDLLLNRDDYVHANNDDRAYETALPGFGRVFPHPFGNKDNKLFNTLLTLSPAGDALTLDFAKALVEAEELGQDEVTDYLSISFSSTDYIGHVFGIASLEMEDNLLHVDRTLADLLSFIDTKVGLDNTLIVLSADHGAPEAADYMAEQGLAVERLVPSKFDSNPFMAALKQRFGIGEKLISMYAHPYVYLNRKLIREKGLDLAEVERAVATEFMKINGIALAVSSSDLRSGRLPESPVIEQVRRNFHPKRSGDVYVVQEPYWFLFTDESLPLCTMHGSPWSYDTYVPIIFAGAGVKPQRINRLVHPVDIAATLSAATGSKFTSGARGVVLSEVINN